MKIKTIITTLLGALLLASCASLQNLREDIYLQSLNIDLIQDKEYYLKVIRRWPDIDNPSQIQRRALIFSAHPKKADLQKLDETRDEESEFQILKRLNLRRLVAN